MNLKPQDEATGGRIATGFICALVSLKLVVFAVFTFTLLQASSTLAESNSDQTSVNKANVCIGQNMLEALKSDKPEIYAKIEQAANKVPNGNSRFWKIEKQGLKTSWLLGTMHFSDSRVVTLPPVVELAFQNAGTVVIENTQILDQKEMMTAMAKLRPMMFFTDGSTLEDYYSQNTIDLIKNRLVGRDVPYFLGKRMQPWVLATSLVLPFCELERKRQNKKVLDFIIGTRAREEGKKLVGLESVTEQISAMAGLSFEFHLKSLEETLQLGSKIDDMMETMVQLYVDGEVGKFWPLMEYLSPKSSRGPEGERFKYVLITRRNNIMFERSLPQFEKGGVFMAVGALHLPEKTGVVQQLKEAGFTVTPAL